MSNRKQHNKLKVRKNLLEKDKRLSVAGVGKPEETFDLTNPVHKAAAQLAVGALVLDWLVNAVCDKAQAQANQAEQKDERTQVEENLITEEELLNAYQEGKSKGATHVVIMRDDFDYGHYIRLVFGEEELEQLRRNPGEMQRLVDVYDLNLPYVPASVTRLRADSETRVNPDVLSSYEEAMTVAKQLNAERIGGGVAELCIPFYQGFDTPEHKEQKFFYARFVNLSSGIANVGSIRKLMQRHPQDWKVFLMREIR